MATLIKQWGKYVVPQNEYVVQAEADLSNITPTFGDRVYIIATGQHKIYGESGWVVDSSALVI